MFEKEKEVMLLSPTEQMWWDDAFAKGYAEGFKEGFEQGRKEGILLGVTQSIGVVLKTRFGDEGEVLMPLVRQLRGLDLLFEFLKAAITATDLDTLCTSLVIEICGN